MRTAGKRGASGSSLISQNPTCYLNTSSEQTGLINKAFQNQTKQRRKRKKNQKPDVESVGQCPSPEESALRSPLGTAPPPRVQAGGTFSPPVRLHRCFQFMTQRLYDQLLCTNTTMIHCGQP